MNLALIGYGNVGRAFSRLLESRRSSFPFRITGIRTRHGSACDPRGLPLEPQLTVVEESVPGFLRRSQAEILIEVSTLNPFSGEPALTHIRDAFSLGMHVVTANKGPIAAACSSLCAEAKRAGVEFRFESTVMDGTPVFNNVRNNMPGVAITGFTGALNSTSKVVIEALANGQSFAQGIAQAQQMGIAEADPSYDLDGWDSAAKCAALANVLLNANCTAKDVRRTGIGDLKAASVRSLASDGKRVVLISQAAQDAKSGVSLHVEPRILPATDILASVRGTSNALLLHTDLLGTVGIVSINPGVEQTAYGLFSDIVDIARG